MYQKQRDFNAECDHRRALRAADECVQFGHVTLGCPEGNNKPDMRAIHMDGAYPLLRCRVCGIGMLSLDTDMRRGFWAGTVAWGPNQFESTISETAIDSYRVYVVNYQLHKLGVALATQEAKLWATLFNSSHCDKRYYSVDLVKALPVGATYFMVVPVTKSGLELSVGPTSERIEDLGNVVGSMSAAGPLMESSMLAAMVSIMLTCIFLQ